MKIIDKAKSAVSVTVQKLPMWAFAALWGTWLLMLGVPIVGVDAVIDIPYFEPRKAVDAMAYAWLGWLGGAWWAIGLCWARWRR